MLVPARIYLQLLLKNDFIDHIILRELTICFQLLVVCAFIFPQTSTAAACWAPGRATALVCPRTCWSAAPRRHSAASPGSWWKAPCLWSAGTTRDTSGSSPTATPLLNKVKDTYTHTPRGTNENIFTLTQFNCENTPIRCHFHPHRH